MCCRDFKRPFDSLLVATVDCVARRCPRRHAATLDWRHFSYQAWGWLVREQVRSLPEGDWRHWRQPIQGGWGFSLLLARLGEI